MPNIKDKIKTALAAREAKRQEQREQTKSNVLAYAGDAKDRISVALAVLDRQLEKKTDAKQKKILEEMKEKFIKLQHKFQKIFNTDFGKHPGQIAACSLKLDNDLSLKYINLFMEFNQVKDLVNLYQKATNPTSQTSEGEIPYQAPKLHSSGPRTAGGATVYRDASGAPFAVGPLPLPSSISSSASALQTSTPVAPPPIIHSSGPRSNISPQGHELINGTMTAKAYIDYQTKRWNLVNFDLTPFIEAHAKLNAQSEKKPAISELVQVITWFTKNGTAQQQTQAQEFLQRLPETASNATSHKKPTL